MWYIAKTNKEKTYYLKRVQKVEGAAVWTSNRSEAISFLTEGGIRHYINSHIPQNARPDIQIMYYQEEK